MDRRTFAILCHLLRTVSGLSSTEIVDIEEMVAMFLHVLAHDVKNRVIQREFVRFGETVSRHFNLVLLVVVRLYEELIKRPVPVTNNCNDQHWKCFEVIRFAETFADVGSNEPGGYDGFDMGDGNEEFPPEYSQGIDLS
ncbi:hypothetical protein IC582_003287 [Cucumis melo]